MSDDIVPYTGMPLRGEKLSMGSPGPSAAGLSVREAAAACREVIGITSVAVARAATVLWPALSFVGVIALWAAPALLLSRYRPDQLFDALAGVALKPTGRELLTLSLVLTYIVLTGLMLGRLTAVQRRKPMRVLLRVAIAPLVAVSLAATFISAVPLFFGALILCFPNLT